MVVTRDILVLLLQFSHFEAGVYKSVCVLSVIVH